MTLIADSQQRKFTDEDVQQAGMFAAHAAIAIENAGLFESLENANRELSLAYDETIEGWSRALDLRDKETEGHSLRVTQLALSLAEVMKVPPQNGSTIGGARSCTTSARWACPTMFYSNRAS